MTSPSTDAPNRLVTATVFGAFLLLVLGVFALPQQGFVVVVTDPRRPPADMLSVIASAGGSFVEGGRVPWMAVAYSDDAGFAGRLMRAGAILVLNHRLAAGCRHGA